MAASQAWLAEADEKPKSDEGSGNRNFCFI